MKTRWVVLSLSLGLLGCTSTEDRCEVLCQWLAQCESSVEVTCSRADIDRCVDEYDAKSDHCQSVVDDLADCVDEQDKVCSAVRTQCGSKATEYLTQCY